MWYPAQFTERVSLWLRWFLKRILKSKCVLAQVVEEYEICEWDGEQKIW